MRPWTSTKTTGTTRRHSTCVAIDVAFVRIVAFVLRFNQIKEADIVCRIVCPFPDCRPQSEGQACPPWPRVSMDPQAPAHVSLPPWPRVSMDPQTPAHVSLKLRRDNATARSVPPGLNLEALGSPEP